MNTQKLKKDLLSTFEAILGSLIIVLSLIYFMSAGGLILAGISYGMYLETNNIILLIMPISIVCFDILLLIYLFYKRYIK